MNEIPNNKTIILFDGECTMCNKYILFIAEHDINDNFRFLSIKNKKIIELKKTHAIEPENISSICIIDSNEIKSKSKAVLKIASMLKFPYNLLIVFYVIPGFLRDIIYDLVAKNRYRIFGKVDECSIVKKHANLIQDKLID